MRSCELKPVLMTQLTTVPFLKFFFFLFQVEHSSVQSFFLKVKFRRHLEGISSNVPHGLEDERRRFIWSDVKGKGRRDRHISVIAQELIS